MKKGLLITGAALALLIVAAVGAFAYGGRGMMAGDVSPAGVERGAYHDQMEEILESGSYADLEALRAETGMPMMPWVTDDATFQQAQERHEEMETAYGEGPHMGAYGPRDGTGFQRGRSGMMGGGQGRGSGFGGCPMWDDGE